MNPLETQMRSRALPVLSLAAAALLLVVSATFAIGSQVASGETPAVIPPPASVKHSTLSLAGIPQHNETLGSLRAPVKMLYFGDPQCPVCLEFHKQVLPALVRKYVRAGKLQIQWHGYVVIGPASATGDRFIAAAGRQGHLWDVLVDIMTNQGPENSGWLNTSLLEQIGDSIKGLDVGAAMAAASSPAIGRELVADTREGKSRGVVGVPSIFYGRRSGPLKALDSTKDAPVEFERPINRLLRSIDSR
jgi:protein-disulfide isomerase